MPTLATAYAMASRPDGGCQRQANGRCKESARKMLAEPRSGGENVAQEGENVEQEERANDSAREMSALEVAPPRLALRYQCQKASHTDTDPPLPTPSLFQPSQHWHSS